MTQLLTYHSLRTAELSTPPQNNSDSIHFRLSSSSEVTRTPRAKWPACKPRIKASVRSESRNVDEKLLFLATSFPSVV